VGFQIDCNHLPVLQERRQDLVEHFGSSQPAVQQDQRFSGTVDFVIEIEAVYRSVPGFEGKPTAPVNSVEVSRLFPTRQIQALKPRTLGAKRAMARVANGELSAYQVAGELLERPEHGTGSKENP